MLESWTTNTKQFVQRHFDNHNINHTEGDPEYYLNYIVSDTVIRSLCQSTHISIILYDHLWDNYPIVLPFYRGELTHDDEVERIYNESDYAIISHTPAINSKRLSEVTASSCTAVVLYFRSIAEILHWDNEPFYSNLGKT